MREIIITQTRIMVVVKLLIAFLFIGIAEIADAQYLETFSTSGKGYLINCMDNLTGVNWTLSPWSNDMTCSTAGNRDAGDYFNTTAGGLLESSDLDQEVYWESPLMNISSAGTVSLSVALTWATFDVDAVAGLCEGDYIKVLYSVNGGAYTMVANQFGGNSCATVAYPLSSAPMQPFTSSGTVNQGGINGTTLKIRVAVFTNVTAEIVTIDNVSVPQAGVTIGCAPATIGTTTTQAGSCNSANGTITVTATGATPPYNVAWSGPSSGNPAGTEIASSGGSYTITPLSPGAYTVSVTDAASCAATTMVSVTTASALSLSTQILNTSCAGTADGEIDLIVNGGVPPFTYSWDNLPGGGDPQDQVGLLAGTYNVTVNDNVGCSANTSAVISTQVAAAYNEQFNVANKGYLANYVDDFAGVNWTMTPWLNEPGVPFGRDNADFFRTSGGVLVGEDFDQDICWSSPLINLNTGTMFSVDLAWTGFDVQVDEYINVKYSIDGGGFITLPNQVGGGSGTIQYAAGLDQSGSATVTKTGLSGSTIQVQVCAQFNANLESMTIDNVSIPNSLGVACPKEINVKQNITSIPDNGSFNYGNVNVGSNDSKVFTIENTGGTTLMLTGAAPNFVMKGGTHPGDFTITQPALTSIPGNGSTPFTVVFAPGGAGARSCTLTIHSDDSDEEPYDITLNGTGIPACTTNTWVGGSGTDWFVGANWSCGTVPVAANDVVIPMGTPNCIIAGGTAQVHNLTIDAGASLTNNATLNINGGGVLTNNGMYKGNGSFTGGLFTNPVGGNVSPGSSPGCLSYGAGYTNLGTLNIEVNGTTTACTDYDQLIVTGTATLGGTLNVTIGYTPSPGDQVTFIDATTVSGTFATLVAPPGWSVIYNSPSSGKVTLTFACPGGTVTNMNTSISYCTIQAAIDAVATLAGHTISVGAGTYNERVTISKGIKLQGVDSLTTIIDGTGLPSGGVGLGSGIRINSGITNVTIKNLRVKNFLSASGTNANAGIWAQGGNNNLLIDKVSVFDNVGGSGIYVEGAGGIDSITITNSRISGHTGGARGIGIWNGLKTKINISNNHVYGNVCCGIELQTGTSSGVTMNNNNVHDNGDNGMSANGLTGPGVNVISGNTLVNNGRFGMEIKNPDGTGAASGPGSIVVSNNNVSRTNPVVDSPSFRDVAGIAVFRRDLTAANVNVPKGVRVLNNNVSGYVQPNAVGEGYGIVAEGLDHTISTNTLNGNDIGIQRQAGNTPYTALPAIVNGDQAATNTYFGRGNSPITCNVVLTGNIFGNILANGIDTRDVGLPAVTSITNNGPICPGGGNAVFTLTGTANAIVTYNINGGGSTTVTLDGMGTGMVTIMGASMNQTLNLISIAITGGSCREISGSSTATVMTAYTSVQDGAYNNPATWGGCPAPNPIPMGVTVNMNHNITNSTTLVNNGTIMCTFDFINTPTGVLTGTGTISCKLVNQGTVRPGN